MAMEVFNLVLEVLWTWEVKYDDGFTGNTSFSDWAHGQIKTSFLKTYKD